MIAIRKINSEKLQTTHLWLNSNERQNKWQLSQIERPFNEPALVDLSCDQQRQDHVDDHSDRGQPQFGPVGGPRADEVHDCTRQEPEGKQVDISFAEVV